MVGTRVFGRSNRKKKKKKKKKGGGGGASKLWSLPQKRWTVEVSPQNWIPTPPNMVEGSFFRISWGFFRRFWTFSYQPYENRAKNWVNWLFFNYCTSHYGQIIDCIHCTYMCWSWNIIDWQNLTIPWLIGPEGNFLLFFEKNFMSSFFKAFPLRVSRNRIATPPPESHDRGNMIECR